MPRHKILCMGYRLESIAFMMTYNSTTCHPGVWREFKDFIVSLARHYGAKAWAACLEESQHAQQRGDGGKHALKRGEEHSRDGGRVGQ